MKKSMLWFGLLALVCVGCFGDVSPSYKGGYITRVSGKITHEVTGDAVANYKLYIIQPFVGPNNVYTDSIKTDDKGNYDLVFVSTQFKESHLIFPTEVDDLGGCATLFSIPEGKETEYNVAVLPLQPLFVFKCTKKAQELGATQVEVTLSRIQCKGSKFIIDPAKPENIFDVAPESDYLLEAVFKNETSTLYTLIDNFYILTRPLIYTAK